MTDTYEKCSCGARQKSKCVKESGLEGGSDEAIARVLANSLPAMCRTLGDYQVSVVLNGYGDRVSYRIYREMQ